MFLQTTDVLKLCVVTSQLYIDSQCCAHPVGTIKPGWGLKYLVSWRWPNFESKISSFVVTKSAEVSRDLGKSPGFVATSAAAYDLTPCCKYQVFVAINGWKLSIPSTPQFESRDMHKRECMVCRNVNRQHFILATGAKNATFDSWCSILVWY